jgi:hypothetical protein
LIPNKQPVVTKMAHKAADRCLHSSRFLPSPRGAGAASVLNMWYDANIEAIMSRTACGQFRGGVSPGPNRLGLFLAGFAVVGSGFGDEPYASNAVGRHHRLLCATLTVGLRRD